MIPRVERLIINLDTTLPVKCNWDDCDRRSRSPYQIILHEHLGKCSSWIAQYGRHYHHSFCSEDCKDLWLAASGWFAHDTAYRNRGRIYGNHTAGNKLGRYR